MVIREVQDRDFVQLAEMRWTHAVEDDETYGEHNTDGVTKSVFIEEFVAFLYTNKEYKIFVAEDENAKILSAMFVYLIPTIPTPNAKREFIAYLTKVFTLEEYRGKGIGTRLLDYVRSTFRQSTANLSLHGQAKNRQNGINLMGFPTPMKFLSADYNNKKYKRTIG